MIPPDDRGFTLGDGVFETVLADGGRLIGFERHMARMRDGALALGLPAPDSLAAEAAARSALTQAGLQVARAAVRLTWTAGSGGRGLDRPWPAQGRLVVTCAPAPLPETPARLHLSGIRRNEGSITSRHKTLSYLDNVLARREALAAGAHEAVMLNNAGALACAAAANLFWVWGGRLFTPALVCGALEGTVRAQVLTCAAALNMPAEAVVAGPEALAGADAVFLTSSLIGLRPAAGSTEAGAGTVRRLAAAVARLRSS